MAKKIVKKGYKLWQISLHRKLNYYWWFDFQNLKKLLNVNLTDIQEPC